MAQIRVLKPLAIPALAIDYGERVGEAWLRPAVMDVEGTVALDEYRRYVRLRYTDARHELRLVEEMQFDMSFILGEAERLP